MKKAASVSGRNKAHEKAVQAAQKIIISHITHYLGSILWGVSLINDPRFEAVPLPTLRDYETLISILENDELFIPEKPRDGLMLIGIRNVYFARKDGELWEEHRPEGMGRKEVPKIAYLVVKENIFRDKGKNRFKSRNMAKFLQDVRALAIPKLFKGYMSEEVKKKQKDKISYRERLLKAGYDKKSAEKHARKNSAEVKRGRPVRATPQSLIREEFFNNNRKKFEKTRERLRKMGIAV